MNVQSSTEVRTVNAVHFRSNVKDVRLRFMVHHGSTPAVMCKAVKVVALANGKFSIRTLGGGLGRTIHVSGDTFMVVVTEGGGTIRHGSVRRLFEAAM